MKKQTTAELLASLASAPLRTVKSKPSTCCLCLAAIEKGEKYRDGGHGRRAHDECWAEKTIAGEAEQ